jgi:hypothetical protein
MELSAKTLAELLAALRCTDDAGMNKRKCPRVGLRVRTDVWHRTAGRLSVWVRDLSAGGANIVAPLEMHDGDDVALLLAGKADGEDKVNCTVMHCRKIASGLYAVGLKFNVERGGLD